MDRMKVALIVPKCGLPLMHHVPPLNLGYLASYLRKTMPDVEVKIFDGSAGDDPEKGISDFQPSVVGITSTTSQAPAAYRLGDTIKRNWPNILTVMGGIHATVMPKEALEHFDVVVVGEGEKTFSQIVQGFQNNQPQQGIFEGEPIENLDDIPSPAFDLLNMQLYLRQGINVLPGLESPNISTVTSRGCPYRCAFCWNSSRKAKVRFSSARRIVEEILFLRDKYGINSVFFSDDEFLINTERVKELSVLFKEYGISKWLRWGCQVRARTLTIPLLEMVKDMGCVVLGVGFESGSERMLRYLKSGSATLATNEKALDMGGQVGMTMMGTFIFGTPTETLEEMKQTLNWALTHPKLKLMFVYTMTPYPGTKVWELCLRKGLLPGKVNYEILIPNASTNFAYLVTTVPHETFIRFMNDINRIVWFVNQVRPNSRRRAIKKFVFVLGFPTGWKLLANHPRLVLQEFLNITKN